MAWSVENAVAGAMAGLTTVAILHPLDVVRTRFQVHDGRDSVVPKYRSTANALLSITRTEGIRGLYAGLFPAVLGSSLSWGMYFFIYNNVKSRNQQWSGKELGAGLHLISAAEAGGIVCLFSNPIWLIKTRLQLQSPGPRAQKPYTGFADCRNGEAFDVIGFHLVTRKGDAMVRIVKDEGWWALYKGLGPSLLLVSHGSLQFMAYEEGRKLLTKHRSQKRLAIKDDKGSYDDKESDLQPLDFAVLGGLSKIFATSITYPYQVIRARIQQRPDCNGRSKYTSTWHALRETLRFEGVPGLYKGIIPNFLKNVPASSLTFLVYEAVLRIMKS